MTLYASPSTENYALGRGILYMGVWSGVTPPASLVDVGAVRSIDLQVTEEKLEHFVRRAQSRKKDKVVTLESGYTLNFTLDEMSVANMKAFLRASQAGAGILHANEMIGAEYAFRFESDNAEGPNAIYRFWKVRLSPAAALGLISDDWIGLQFTGEGLADDTYHPSSPFFDMIYSGATTTTTTTTAP